MNVRVSSTAGASDLNVSQKYKRIYELLNVFLQLKRRLGSIGRWHNARTKQAVNPNEE